MRLHPQNTLPLVCLVFGSSNLLQIGFRGPLHATVPSSSTQQVASPSSFQERLFPEVFHDLGAHLPCIFLGCLNSVFQGGYSRHWPNDGQKPFLWPPDFSQEAGLSCVQNTGGFGPIKGESKRPRPKWSIEILSGFLNLSQLPLCAITKIIELEVAFPSSSFGLTSVPHPKGGRLIDFFYLPFK